MSIGEALRLNDICPESVAMATDGRIKLTGLDYVSNDNELQSEPIFNDGYTAPEIYRGKKVDKRADIFSVGALLYTWLTGERIRARAGARRRVRCDSIRRTWSTPRLEKAIRRAIAVQSAGTLADDRRVQGRADCAWPARFGCARRR